MRTTIRPEYGRPHLCRGPRRPRVRRVIVTHPTPDRLPEALSLLRASDEAIWGATDWTESDLREDWERIDLDRDAWLIELDGRLAGVAQLLDRRGARFIGDAYVHPELTGRGVGSRVLELLESRVHASSSPTGRTRGVSCSRLAHLVGDDRAPAALPGQRFVARTQLLPHGRRRGPGAPRPRVARRSRGAPARPRPRTGARCTRRRRRPSRTNGDTSRRRMTRGGSARSSSRASTRRSCPWSGTATRSLPSRSTTRSGTATGAGSGCSASARRWRRRGLGLALLRESFRRFRDTGETTVALGRRRREPHGRDASLRARRDARPLAGRRLGEAARPRRGAASVGPRQWRGERPSRPLPALPDADRRRVRRRLRMPQLRRDVRSGPRARPARVGRRAARRWPTQRRIRAAVPRGARRRRGVARRADGRSGDAASPPARSSSEAAAAPTSARSAASRRATSGWRWSGSTPTAT